MYHQNNKFILLIYSSPFGVQLKPIPHSLFSFIRILHIAFNSFLLRLQVLTARTLRAIFHKGLAHIIFRSIWNTPRNLWVSLCLARHIFYYFFSILSLSYLLSPFNLDVVDARPQDEPFKVSQRSYWPSLSQWLCEIEYARQKENIGCRHFTGP